MGLLDFLKQPDFNQNIKSYQQELDALLLDVRTPQEYNGGRVPGSINLPLQAISTAASVAPNKAQSLYVYCQSGARSRKATAALKQMGYTNVKNIGGIASYRGPIEK